MPTGRASGRERGLQPLSEHQPRPIVTSAKRLSTNTVWGLANQVSAIPLTLVLVPVLLHHLGRLEFGEWALVAVLLSYTGLTEFGLRTPLTRDVAAQWATGDDLGLSRVVNTAILFYGAIGVAALGATALLAPWLIDHLFHDPGHTRLLTEVLLIAVGAFALNLSLTPLGAVLNGLQRLTVDSGIAITSRALGVVLAIASLLTGHGLLGLAISQVLTAVVTNVAYIVAVRLVCPQLRMNPMLFHWATLRATLRFGSQVQVSRVALIVEDQFGRTVLAYLLGPAALAAYQIADRLFVGIRSLPMPLMLSMLPAASELEKRNLRAGVTDLYFKGLRYVAMVSAPLFIGAAVISFPFIPLWVGGGYGQAAPTAAIIIGSYFIWITTGPGDVVLLARGRPQVGMWASLIRLAIHVVAAIVLIRLFGYYGAPISVAVSTTLSMGYYQVRIHRILAIRWIDTLRLCLLRPLAASAIAAGIFVALTLVVPTRNIFVVVGLTGVYCCVYLGALTALGGIGTADLRILVKASPWRPSSPAIDKRGL